MEKNITYFLGAGASYNVEITRILESLTCSFSFQRKGRYQEILFSGEYLKKKWGAIANFSR